MSYFYVYDIRTQMNNYVACFNNVDDAKKYAEEKLGEHAYVSVRSLGSTKTKGKIK